MTEGRRDLSAEFDMFMEKRELQSIFDFNIKDKDNDKDSNEKTEEDDSTGGSIFDIKVEDDEEDEIDTGRKEDDPRNDVEFSEVDQPEVEPDEHLTAQEFVAALPESRRAFIPEYLMYNNTLDAQGYMGRDTWKAMEKDVYKAQFSDSKMDKADMQAYGAYFLYEMNNSTKQFKVGTLINTTQSDSAALYP